jgi:hypothetical protein
MRGIERDGRRDREGWAEGQRGMGGGIERDGQREREGWAEGERGP